MIDWLKNYCKDVATIPTNYFNDAQKFEYISNYWDELDVLFSESIEDF